MAVVAVLIVEVFGERTERLLGRFVVVVCVRTPCLATPAVPVVVVFFFWLTRPRCDRAS